MSTPQKFVDFLTKSCSTYHCIKNCAEILESHGFSCLKEGKRWDDPLKPLSKYYYTRNGTAIVAFAVGGKYQYGNGMTMTSAHSDIPTLKIKFHPIVNSKSVVNITTELYGGGNWHTWFDRDLGIAGRVVINLGDNKIESRYICIDEAVLHISSVAIHYDRDMNTSFKFDKESHLRPLFSLNKNMTDEEINKSFIEYIAKHISVKSEDILDFDLNLFDCNKATLGGANKEFIYSQGLDNRAMTFINLCGFADSISSLDKDPNIRFFSVFDNEEIGSETISGAAGTLLNDFMDRLFRPEDIPVIKRNSYMISADVGHAAHPNYSEYNETNHSPQLGKGCIIKSSANMRYSSDCINRSILRIVGKNHNIPIQDFIIKQTLAGGTTIGPIVSARTGLLTIDVGIPLLAMHSIRETGCVDDVISSIDLIKYFYQDYPTLNYTTE